MRISELLAQAHGLVKLMPTEGTLARDAQGNAVKPNSPEACSVCAMGALMRVQGLGVFVDNIPGISELATVASQLLGGNALWRPKSYWNIPDVNDSYPQLVDEMFTKAIKLAKANEACEVPA